MWSNTRVSIAPLAAVPSVFPNNPIDLQSLKLIDFHLLRWVGAATPVHRARRAHERVRACGQPPAEGAAVELVVKWAVCIITTNAAPPNAHPMRRQHRIECLQKIRRLRVGVRRRRDLCTTRHLTSPLNRPADSHAFALARTFGFFVGTICGKPRFPHFWGDKGLSARRV